MRNFWVVLACVCGPALMLTGCAGGPGSGGEVRETRLLGDFETDEGSAGWAGGSGVTVERADEQATKGNRALRVTVPENGRAGVEYYPSDGDWSRYTSLRMDVVYPYEDRLAIGVRVDDADSSDYASRYNRDDGSLALGPGRNDIEIPLRALASGQPGCRGLDLTSIRSLYLFPLSDHPECTFFVDNVRLEDPGLHAFTSPALVEGFEEVGGLAGWQASEGVQVAPAGDHVSEGERALRVRLPAGGWPGISRFGEPQNWLPYEWLLLDVYNDTDDTMMLGVWAHDGTKKVTIGTALRPGPNRVQVPMDIFSGLRLRTITGLCIFVSHPGEGTTLYVDNIRLARRPAEHGTPAAPVDVVTAGSLALDYGGLASIGRNTGFLANVYMDCEKEEPRILRLRPVDKEVGRHVVAVPTGAIVVSSFFLDHGTWYLDTRAVEVVGPETTVNYEPGDFGF